MIADLCITYTHISISQLFNRNSGVSEITFTKTPEI